MEKIKSSFGLVFSSYKKLTPLLFLGALTLAIPITMTLSQQQQDLRQRASEISPTPVPVVKPTLPPLPCGSLGDVNFDGRVDAVDALFILRYTGGMEPFSQEQIRRADVNGNKIIDAVDGLIIQRFVAGIITTFSACAISPTPSPVVVIPTTAPLTTAPLLSATQKACSYITLKWSFAQPTFSVKSYDLFVQNKDRQWILLSSLPSWQNNYTVSGLVPNTNYEFLVNAVGFTSKLPSSPYSAYTTCSPTPSPIIYPTIVPSYATPSAYPTKSYPTPTKSPWIKY